MSDRTTVPDVETDAKELPACTAALAARSGNTPAHLWRTRVIKVSRLFARSAVDGDGRPPCDEASTGYLDAGAIQNAGELGPRIDSKDWRRRCGRAKKRVALDDAISRNRSLREQESRCSLLPRRL